MAAAKSQAVDALVDEDYQRALDLFTEAIGAEPADFDLYVGRAAAYIKLENYLNAVSDARKAVELSPGNYRGYLKNGEAAFHLEEYETAQEAFKAALARGAPEAKCKSWLRKCQAELADEVEEISPVPARGYGIRPDTDAQRAAAAAVVSSAKPTSAAAGPHKAAMPSSSSADYAPTAAPQDRPGEPAAQKYRHQFYQTQSAVELAVLAKGVSSDRLKVDIRPRSLAVIIFDAKGQEEYKLSVDLFAEVDPAKSRFEILTTKVEVRLSKQQPGQWPALEAGATKPSAVPSSVDVGQSQAPAYPSSFKRRPVDWDKLEADLKKEEKDEKLEGDAALQKLFQGIYANADEDTRRAMNKSFQESNGTVLSTNWQEIGSKKTEYKPADK